MFNKSVVVGVSITPEVGLEVAQIDFATQTVLKYGVRPLEFNSNSRQIADLDIFKDTLQNVLSELQIPSGAEIYLNIPAAEFKVNDYPAALDESQLTGSIEDELADSFFFKNDEPCISAVLMPNSTMQFNKIAYTAVSKTMLMEVAMIIKSLGYKVKNIDTSVNSVLNALIYKDRINVDEHVNWVLLIVENFGCRIIPMLGKNYVDSFEERISIAEVLGDAENYSTVINAVTPLLKNLPSQYLCVVSKTNAISAEVLADKLAYNAPIIHQEANNFSKEAFMELAPSVNPELATTITLDIIGAAIGRDFAPYTNAHFNLFNKSLGDIYTSEQPPELQFGSTTIVLSNAFLIKLFIIVAILIGVPVFLAIAFLTKNIADLENEKANVERNIAQINQFLKDNESISSDLFDEGDEIRLGLGHNKNIYSYYTIVGTEIPKKLWLTHLKLSDKVTIEGQADNLESVYAFFRSIKDYNPSSDIKLQKLGLAANSKNGGLSDLSDNGDFDEDSILTSINADFYEFKISNEPELSKTSLDKDNNGLPEALEPAN